MLKRMFIVLISIFLLSGCFKDNLVVVDKQIQDPIRVFETDDKHPQGYIKEIPRLYILTIRDLDLEENTSVVVPKKIFFKYNLGAEFDIKDLKKE